MNTFDFSKIPNIKLSDTVVESVKRNILYLDSNPEIEINNSNLVRFNFNQDIHTLVKNEIDDKNINNNFYHLLKGLETYVNKNTLKNIWSKLVTNTSYTIKSFSNTALNGLGLYDTELGNNYILPKDIYEASNVEDLIKIDQYQNVSFYDGKNTIIILSFRNGNLEVNFLTRITIATDNPAASIFNKNNLDYWLKHNIYEIITNEYPYILLKEFIEILFKDEDIKFPTSATIEEVLIAAGLNETNKDFNKKALFKGDTGFCFKNWNDKQITLFVNKHYVKNILTEKDEELKGLLYSIEYYKEVQKTLSVYKDYLNTYKTIFEFNLNEINDLVSKIESCTSDKMLNILKLLILEPELGYSFSFEIENITAFAVKFKKVKESNTTLFLEGTFIMDFYNKNENSFHSLEDLKNQFSIITNLMPKELDLVKNKYYVTIKK